MEPINSFDPKKRLAKMSGQRSKNLFLLIILGLTVLSIYWITIIKMSG